MTGLPQFQLNHKTVSLADSEPTESLLRWLKRQRLSGTKEGCADGDCGACTVALIEVDAYGVAQYRAVNSCLLPIGFLPGREVLSVEALAIGDDLHPVQKAMVDCAGSQCGYCTPGFVMSLFAGYYAGELTDTTTEGNLCRCTGYRPIRAAADELRALGAPADRFSATLATPRKLSATTALGAFHNPMTIDAALAIKTAQPDAQWIAGATDLGVNLSHGQKVASVLIALDRIAELKRITVDDAAVWIGAGVALSRVESELAGIFPALDQMLPWFAARQVRNRATFGGNLGSASPIGDLLPVLLALDAQVICRSTSGERSIGSENYFLDYRKTARADDELIVGVRIPRRPRTISASYKVAKRQVDDISIVAAVFMLELDDARRVRHARLAYGGLAAVPRRARSVESYLQGRILDDTTLTETGRLLEAEFEPLSDHRAGADYRRKLSATLFAKFVAEHCR